MDTAFTFVTCSFAISSLNDVLTRVIASNKKKEEERKEVLKNLSNSLINSLFTIFYKESCYVLPSSLCYTFLFLFVQNRVANV